MHRPNASMADLATSIHLAVGRPVIDKTGITGTFDIRLVWARDPSDTSLPTIFGALEQQVGLKLVSAVGPAKYLVVDHVEEPSPN